MSESNPSDDIRWSSRWLFVLAAAGSAVGLGNIWKFPYVAGENGGGAFVLIYLVCVGLVGAPIMMAEIALGREGRSSPITTMTKLAASAGRNSQWSIIGWMGVIAGVMILSFYAVIAGWALKYIGVLASDEFKNAGAEVVESTFNGLLASPVEMILWQTVFMVGTIWIVARGVSKGLEKAIRWFMPLLFVMLIVLLGYSLRSGGFEQGWQFMFDFKWEDVGPGTWIMALGQAFFTLSLGMGTMMVYGSYVPSEAKIGSTVATIVALDTVVAISAGLVIFPLVFVNNLDVAQGPGLMFVTMPLAFGQLPFGSIFGSVFFLLVSFAAITSAISLTEPAISYLVEKYNSKRWRVAVGLGFLCWLLGLGTVFSFNIWADLKPVFGLNFFDLVDQISSNVLLPLGGLLIAIFIAWRLPRETVLGQIEIESEPIWTLWKVVTGIVAPASVLVVFLNTFVPFF